MIVAFDLDGLICSAISNDVAVSEVKSCVPNPTVVEFMRELHNNRHDLVIYTTRDGSLMLETEAWLNKHNVPYHHVIYGLPKRNLYFSTDSVRFLNKENAVEQVRLYGGGVLNVQPKL